MVTGSGVIQSLTKYLRIPILLRLFVTTQAVIASTVREAISGERIGDCFAAARLAMTGG